MDWLALWHLFSTLVTVMVVGRLLVNTVLDIYFFLKRRFK